MPSKRSLGWCYLPLAARRYIERQFTIQVENTVAPSAPPTMLCALPRGLKKLSPALSVLSGCPRTFQATEPFTM
jgi:hypothetical protein